MFRLAFDFSWNATTTTAATTTTTTPVPGTVFTAIASGVFTNPAIWSVGVAPIGLCSIEIPAGFTITLRDDVLDVEVTTLTIGGTLVLISSGGFAFQYAVNIIVQSGGTLQEDTSLGFLYLRFGSLFMLYPGATYFGQDTEVYTYTSLPAAESVDESFTFGSYRGGPFTFAVLSTGFIQQFSYVTFVAGITGEFSEGSTWLGGLVPTVDLCSSIGGCGLFVASGCSLSTSSFNGQCDINFQSISVDTDATLQLGTSGSSTGFSFTFAFTFSISGKLQFMANSGSVFLPFGSIFNFLSGATFISTSSFEIRIYNGNVANGGSLLITASASFIGPYYAQISVEGSIETDSNRK